MLKFSVIIPCFNLEKTIGDTLINILKQKFEDFEVIVVDDGSTDKTLEVIRRFEKEYAKKIKVFTKTNGGVSSARNFGVNKSKGEYIFFLDGDDLADVNLLKDAKNIFENENVDMFSFGYAKVDEELSTTHKQYSFKKYHNNVLTGEEFQKLFFKRQITQCMCSFIIKKTVIINNSITFDEGTKYAEDQEFQMRCVSRCNSIFYSSKIYFYYVQREGSAINQKIKRDNFDVYFRMGSHLKEPIKKHYNNYLCYVFIANIRGILKRGAETETVEMLLNIDYVLKTFKMQKTKHSILTAGFIVFYKLYLKRYIIKKYNINKVNLKESNS